MGLQSGPCRTGNSWTAFLQATFGPTTESDFVQKQVVFSFCGGQRVRLLELEDRQHVEVLALSSEKADVPVEMMMDVFGQARP